ncbi:hypothetical protein Tco_1425027, partial [Tanacetum coccineum]
MRDILIDWIVEMDKRDGSSLFSSCLAMYMVNGKKPELDRSNASAATRPINAFDPCWQDILISYLNNSAVQRAFNAKPTSWDEC